MDFSAIRSRLASAEGRLYWRSLGELADTPEFREYLHREFPEQASEWNDPKGRRQFLKLMSASLALAGVGACTTQPAEKIVPYVRQPEELVPGRPLFFASAIPLGGVAQPVLVESHMGRPTKIEGNPEHPASLGATDAITQAVILSLYDPDRAQTITYRGEMRPWSSFLGAVQGSALQQKARQGAGLRILTGPITSPSLAELLATVLRDYPKARWHQYEPVARDGARQASATTEPIYHFDKADVIVALDSDFLSCGPGAVRYARDFADRRRVMDDRKTMNRLYAVESTLSLTGAKADHRLPMRAGDIEGFARQLASSVGAGGAPQGGRAPRTATADETKWAAAVAKDLQAHRGRSVVVPGDYQPAAVHQLAQAMNQALGNVGTTVTYAPAIEARAVDQHASLAELVRAMDGGQVEMLLILGGNPVFTAPADLRFAEKLTKVGLTIYHGTHVDETANLCHWNIPETHPLETWGDARAYDGTVTLIQPLIAPIFESRSAYDVLGAFTSQPDRRAHDMVKDYWTRAFGGQGGWTIRDENGQPFKNADAFWTRALHDGFIAGTAVTQGGPATPFAPAPAATPTPATKPAAGAGSAPGAPGAGAQTGAPASAGRTQEGSQLPAPDARSREANPSAALPQAQLPVPPGGQPQAAPATGGTAVQSGAAPTPPPVEGGLEIVFRPDPTIWDGRFANNGWLQELPKPITKITWDPAAWISPKLAEEQGLRNGDVVELRYRGNTARMPVYIVPGQPHQSVTVFFGYGRRMAGRVGNAVQGTDRFNAFLLRTSDAPWFGSGLEISKTGERHLLATTQSHHLMEGRAPVRVATLEQYTHEPAIIHEMGHRPPRAMTMYPEHEYDGYKWGMAIDLTACSGCGTCTVACQAENNIPVVGKEQVSRSREMHWIRVDHYFAGNLDNPESYHAPVPCMHCENAPCEVVCPVAATSHSAEGLNDMTYNRCVGTRYCSNNCPYKVRRFNFLLYADWDTQSLYPLRNPDVTVRSRGIMEKCTYCVQRINQARVDSKREDRRIRDGEVIPACAAACPTDAIVFGDMNDPNSRVVKLKAQERNYGMLEDINTRPRTTYLAALRNPNPELETAPPAGQRPTDH
jgi:MoCo/4Fe-4S cofactor protein with predicted Tat translocation signal